jgi:2-(1,2-epoxy-1,2-dihydrophenyl)acetyl-CoA isomerase
VELSTPYLSAKSIHEDNMPYETILYAVHENVATITFNRPDKYNALTVQMYADLLHALKEVQRDKNVRAVILTGAGKGFCSGADLIELQAQLGTVSIGDALRAGLNSIALAIRSLEKPVVCALNGVAAGAGAGIALACDMRIASEQATFVFAAFASIGIIPDAGITYFLPQLVGANKALELALFADAKNRLQADQALELGIVNRVVAHEDLMTVTEETAAKLAAMATVAVGLTKRAMYRSVERSLQEALETEAQLQTATFQTRDFQEGIQAFLEKRAPQFKGE